MRYIRQESTDSLLLRRPYFEKHLFTQGLFFLALFITSLIFFDAAIMLTGALSVHDRIIFHTAILILSIAMFTASFWRETGRDFFSFINIVLILYFLMFVIPIFILLYIPAGRTKPNYWDMASAEHSVWIVTISLYSLVFGYILARRNNAGIALTLSNRPSIKRMGIVFVICATLWFIYYLVKSSVMGINPLGLLLYHTRADEMSSRKFSVGVYAIIDFFNKGALYMFLLCFILPRGKSVKKGLILCANLFILFYVLNAVAAGIRMTAKSAVLSVMFICFCFLHYTKKRIGLLKLVLLFAVGISVVIFLNYVRVSAEHRYLVEKDMRGLYRMYAQTFEDFETLCVVRSHIPSTHPHYYGQRFFEEVAYLPIPRAFWSGKPAVYGSRAVLYDIEPWFFNVGYSIGLQSQFYADLGIPGVIAGFIVCGWLVGWVYGTFRKNISNKGIVILYTLVAFNSWLYFKGGFPWINIIILAYLPFYIVLRCIYPYPAKERVIT